MGLFDFVKNGVRQMMIARPENMHDLIVYKHPDRSVPMWTQLTVKSDEGCVFFRDGQIMGVVGAGRHSIDGANIPFLKNWIDAATGGNVLLAELFFVRNQPLRNTPIKFGGQLGGMIDPGTELQCSPRIFGELVVQVLDPVKFIVGLTGQSLQPHDNDAILDYVSKRFRKGCRSVIPEVLQAEGQSVLNVSAVHDELEAAFMKRVPDLEEIGLRVVEIVDFKVSLAPAEQKELRDAWNMVGKAKREAMAMQHQVGVANNPAYMAYMQGQAIKGAGEGMAKGGAGAGVAGLGAQMAVGVGMGQMFQQGMVQPGMQHPRVQPAAGASSVACGKCGAHSQGGGKFCASCGAPLAPPQPQNSFCSNCGTAVSGKFCSGCGAAQGAAAAPPAAQAPPAGEVPPGGVAPSS